MAGNPGAPDPNPFRKAAKPKVSTFSCGKCGAPVTVRYPGHSLSAVCDSCYSVIDTSDDTFRVLATYYKQLQVQPRIDLGARGEINGKTWEVIGFVVRQDAASSFKWEEYLLFNPYYGYRWLTCNNGHWSFVTMLKERPDRSATNATLSDKTFKLFYQGKAEVFFVLGEFYWKVAVGESVGMADFINPPKMLSVEEDNAQRVWSISEYVTPKVIQEAFKVEDDSLPSPVGVAPNQPSPATDTWRKVGPMWGIFLATLFGLQILHCCLAKNIVDYRAPIEYTAKVEGAFNAATAEKTEITTPPFVLEKDMANLDITIESEVDNSWLYVYGELVNDETEETFTFERSIEYYHGYEGGESWSEGSRATSIFMSQVPGGTYRMNLEVDNGGNTVSDRRMFNIVLRRDVGTYHNFLWCLFFISVYPILAWLKYRNMEVARWSDSDYSPFQSSSD